MFVLQYCLQQIQTLTYSPLSGALLINDMKSGMNTNFWPFVTVLQHFMIKVKTLKCCNYINK